MRIFSFPSFSRKALRRTLLAGAVACGMAAPALSQDAPAKPEPDVLVFKNGDQLTGKLVSGTGNSVVFKSDMAGEITVSLDNVKEMRAHGSFAVLNKNVLETPKKIEQDVHPGKVEYADGAVKVESPAGVSSSVPEKDVAFIIDQPTFQKQIRHQSLLSGWKGGATAGATAVQSTNYGTTFNLGVNLVRLAPVISYLPPHDRQTFNLSETYGKLTQPTVPNPTNLPNSVAKTNIFHTDFEYDRYFTRRFYALGDTSFDHNFAQGLNLQQVYGAGFGWTPIQQPIQQLDLKFDIHYEKQQFLQTGGPTLNQNLIGATFGENYRRTLPKKLLLTQTASFLPAFNNSNAYAANGAINLALPTFHRLTVNAGVSDSFINNPSPGYQKNSFQFTTGLGYTF